jgi:cytochrome c biogenesis protein CcmG, thiol:disulfide interchange protein DsbE
MSLRPTPLHRSRLAALLWLGAAAALAACGASGDAGTRVSPSESPVPAAATTATSAPAALVQAADLVDCPAADATVASRADGLPDLTLPCLGDGPSVRLAGLRGHPTVVNLWASWCEPCRDEMPLLADLADAAPASVRVLGVDVQDDPSSALSLLHDLDVHYASVRDDGALTKDPLHWSGLPMTLFVDADGVVTHTERAPIVSAQQLRSLLTTHLGISVAP